MRDQPTPKGLAEETAEDMFLGHTIGDIVIILGSVDIVLGEVDR